jgi:hypothetical protein
VRKLQYLASDHLDMAIQECDHHPTEDAIATMLLYLRLFPHKGREAFEDSPFFLDKADFPPLPSPLRLKDAGRAHKIN